MAVSKCFTACGSILSRCEHAPMRPLLPVILSCLAAVAVAVAAEPPVFTGTAVSVHDGDTLTAVDGDNAQRKVLLAGIDAPEVG